MIRSAATDDLPQPVEIERYSFALDRRSKRNFRYLLTRANAVTHVDEEQGALRGHATALFHRGTSLARLYSFTGIGEAGVSVALDVPHARERGSTNIPRGWSPQ